MKVLVIGSGIMGNGIAQVCAMSGHETTLQDISGEQLGVYPDQPLPARAGSFGLDLQKATRTRQSRQKKAGGDAAGWNLRLAAVVADGAQPLGKRENLIAISPERAQQVHRS